MAFPLPPVDLAPPDFFSCPCFAALGPFLPADFGVAIFLSDIAFCAAPFGVLAAGVAFIMPCLFLPADFGVLLADFGVFCPLARPGVFCISLRPSSSGSSSNVSLVFSFILLDFTGVFVVVIFVPDCNILLPFGFFIGPPSERAFLFMMLAFLLPFGPGVLAFFADLDMGPMLFWKIVNKQNIHMSNTKFNLWSNKF